MLEIPTIDIWEIAKWIVMFSFLLYVIFAAVVVRQIQLMTNTLEVGFETPIKILGYIHLLGSVLIFILALFIL